MEIGFLIGLGLMLAMLIIANVPKPVEQYNWAGVFGASLWIVGTPTFIGYVIERFL